MNTYEPDDTSEDPLAIKPITISHDPPSSAPSALTQSKPVDQLAKPRQRKKAYSHRHPGDAVLLQVFAPNRPELAADARPGLSDGDSYTSSSTASVSPEPKPTVTQQSTQAEDKSMHDVVGVYRPHDHFPTERHSFSPKAPSQSSSWMNGVVSRPEELRARRSYDSNSSAISSAVSSAVSPTWQSASNHRLAVERPEIRVVPQTVKPLDLLPIPSPRESLASDRPLQRKSIDDRYSGEVNLPPMQNLLDVADRGNVRPAHRASYSAASPTSANPPFAGMSTFAVDPNFGQKSHHHSAIPHGSSPRSSVSQISVPSPVSTIGSSELQRPGSHHHHRASFSASSHTTPGSSTTEGFPSPTKTAPSEFVKGAEASKHVTIPSPHAIMAIAAGGFRCKFAGCKAAPFQTQYLLNSHMNVHSDDRPHFCPHPGCPHAEGGRGFKRKNEMKRHQLVHTNPVYMCPFCPDRDHKYPRPDNLQRHVKAHHEGINPNDPRLRAVLELKKGGVGSASSIGKPRKSRR